MGSGIFLSDTFADFFTYRYPKRFLLARRYPSAVLAMALCLPSVSHKSTFLETDKGIELVFGMGASFQLSYTAFK